MTITIVAGWWILPAAITVLMLCLFVWLLVSTTQSSSGLGAALEGIFIFVFLLIGACVSLVSWLLWALMR